MVIFIPGYLIWKNSEDEYKKDLGFSIIVCSGIVWIVFMVALAVVLPNIVTLYCISKTYNVPVDWMLGYPCKAKKGKEKLIGF